MEQHNILDNSLMQHLLIILIIILSAHLARVSPQTALCGESLSTDVAVERSVLQPLNLGLVVSEVLLQVGQLDEGSTALRYVALVRTFTCTTVFLFYSCKIKYY